MTEQQLSEIFRKSVHFFERLKDVRDIPFIGTYPKNSCEVTSSILANAIHRLSPELDVVVVKGTQASVNEKHFWVEAGGIALDPTAHQFPEFADPIFTVIPNPLQKKFSDIERITPNKALVNTEEIRLSRDRQNELFTIFIEEYDLKNI